MKSMKRFLGSENNSSATVHDDEAFEEAPAAFLHEQAYCESAGGIVALKEVADRQKGVVLDIAKSIGSKLMQGKLDLVNVSLPVRIFEPRSYLQKMGDPWVHPRFLDAAAKTSDPAERMKLVVTWFVAGMQFVFGSWSKPFNPILGETYQAQMEDGSKLFMEQVLHHPPVTAYELIGADGMYTMSGMSQPSASVKGGTGLKTTSRGLRKIEFADGGCVYFKFPDYNIYNMVFSSGVPRGGISGIPFVFDLEHRLLCPLDVGVMSGKIDPLLQRGDAISANVYELPPLHPMVVLRYGKRADFGSAKPKTKNNSVLKKAMKMKITSSSGELSDSRTIDTDMLKKWLAPDKRAEWKHLATGAGNWMSHLDFDGERFWTLAEETPLKWIPADDPLPSDCRFREDLRLLESDAQRSQAAKEAMENRQRADAKARPTLPEFDVQI